MEKIEEISAAEQTARAKLDALDSLREQILANALELVSKCGAFDVAARELSLMPGAGIRLDQLPRPSAGGILAACAATPPMDSPADAVARAGKAMEADFSSLSAAFGNVVSAAKSNGE